MTLGNVLSEGQTSLPDSSSARLDAELLLCKVLQCDRAKLYSSIYSSVSDEIVDQFNKLIKKRAQGTPVAYLTGSKEFWSMDFQVNEHTLVPRPETECLVEKILSFVPVQAEFSIADIGTGCGAIAIALAKERPLCNISAIDISEKAIEVAKKNADNHKTDNVHFYQGNLCDDLTVKYNFIVSNPPYVASKDEHLGSKEIRHEPMLALDGGQDGLSAIRQIISTANEHLLPGGWLMLEHGFDQAHAVSDLFHTFQFQNVQTDSDYAGIERITYGQFLKLS